MKLLEAACLVVLHLGGGVSGGVLREYSLSGPVPDTGEEYFTLPFDVPAGSKEVRVSHGGAASASNILDWGLWDANGFRGWGGGNTEDAVVNARAASRSYLAGPVPEGRWEVVVGKPRLAELPGRYNVTVSVRDDVTLPPQPERKPYVPSPPLRTARGWYAGDLHVHSRQSGDATDSLAELAGFAASRGLDWVHVSDHNTFAAAQLVTAVQAQFPGVLLIPGQELTTYHGHAGCVGCSSFVDWRVGYGNVTAESVARAVRAAGHLVVANHVDLYRPSPGGALRNACVGCTWNLAVPPALLDAVEVGVQGWDGYGWIFDWRAVDFWDSLCAQGFRVAAVGGSDDHKGRNATWPASPVGSPTTMVLADALDAASVMAAVRAGRTAVKLRGPSDPLPELVFVPPADGNSTVRPAAPGGNATLVATVTGGGRGNDTELRVLRNGGVLRAAAVTSDPFVLRLDGLAPPSAPGKEDRYRLEVYCGSRPCAITSHQWLAAASKRACLEGTT